MISGTLAENDVLKKQRQALIDAFNKSVRDIRGLPQLSISDTMDVLDVLEIHMKEVVDEYPVIKNFM